ncbi:MAG: hypothetical protein AAF726_04405 [Planctomycetota bacterium]
MPETPVLDAASLGSIDVLFIGEPTASPQPGEVPLVQSWFQSGGNLALFANSTTSDVVANDWLAACGASGPFTTSQVCGNGATAGTYSLNGVGPALGSFGDLRGDTISTTLAREIVLDGTAQNCGECNLANETLIAT